MPKKIGQLKIFISKISKYPTKKPSEFNFLSSFGFYKRVKVY